MPLGSLDQSAGAAVLALLRSLTDEGRAVVMVTHEEQAAAGADRVLSLEDGVLVPAPAGKRAGFARGGSRGGGERVG